MIGRPTVQPNCQDSIRDYLYDALRFVRTQVEMAVAAQAKQNAR
jgi:hypothetical protein